MSDDPIDYLRAVYPLGSLWRMKSNGETCKITRVTDTGLDLVLRLECGWWHVYRTALEMLTDFERL